MLCVLTFLLITFTEVPCSSFTASVFSHAYINTSFTCLKVSLIMLLLQPSILPIQILRVGQFVILCVPGGTKSSPTLLFAVICCF